VTVAIVDYGAGNLPSVARACAACGATATITRNPDAIGGAAVVVVPGVGHFQTAADGLDQRWRQALRAHVAGGRALLGVCLGMQWLCRGSDEAPDATGLGLLDARCVVLPRSAGVKVPHVGWNEITTTSRRSRLLEGLPAGAFAYFTHSYAVPVVAETVATTTHGLRFAAAVEDGLVFGTQFHPEKSGAAGLRMIANVLAAARNGGR
jgi:glutamine amidotransferase